MIIWVLLFLLGASIITYGTAARVDAPRLTLFAVEDFAALRPVTHENHTVLDWRTHSPILSPADCVTQGSRQLKY